MRTGVKKQDKTTEIRFNEASPIIDIRTHNTDLKKRLTEYSRSYPDLCMSLAAALLVVFGALLRYTNGFDGLFPPKPCNNLYDFVIWFTLAILVLNVLYLVGVFEKISAWKAKRAESKR